MKKVFPKHNFKAYDIRGVYPDEIDEEISYGIGRAFASLLQQENSKQSLNLVVSSDMRISSPILKKNVIAGIIDQGANVIDIGLSSSPTFYFTVGYFIFGFIAQQN